MAPRDISGEHASTDPAALRARFLRSFPAISLAIFLSAVDQTIVATALPAIAAELGGVERVSWVVVAYLIAATCAAPVFGQLGDAFGRRRLLFVSVGVFLVGCVVCATAGSLPMLVAGRVVQGVGGGALLTMAQALIGEAVPPRERGRFQAYIAGTFAAAHSFGPVIGGLLTEQAGWRAIFLVTPPFALLCAVLALRLPRVAPARAGVPLRFDWLGLLLFVAFVGPTLFALDQARRVEAAALPWLAGLLALAAAVLWMLLRVERRVPDPILPLGLLSEPSVWRTNLMSALIGGALVGTIAFLPIYLQAVRGLSPAEVGLILLPLSAGGAVGAVFSGQMVARTGRGMVWPSFGVTIAAGLLVFMAFAAERLSLSLLPWLLGLIAVGFGTSYPVVQTTVQVAAGAEQLGAASASVAFSRNLGAATGTALLGAILFGVLALADGDVVALLPRLAAEGPALLNGLAPAQAALLRAELAEAFRVLFLGAAALAAMAAVLAMRVPLRRF